MLQGKTGGVTIPQLDRELAMLVQKVQCAGRAGTLTLKIKVSPNAKRGVRIEDEVSVKEPKMETGVSFFFTDASGTLLRNDPNQSEMNFTTVADEQPAAPKIVNG
jgi:hypothetical protein